MTDEHLVAPHSVEAEQAVLGCLLMFGEAVALAAEMGLTADDFYLADHRVVMSALQGLHDDGEPIDLALVIDRVRRIDPTWAADAAGRVHALASRAGNVAALRAHCRTVREASQHRQILELTWRLQAAVGDANQSPRDLVALADTHLQRIVEGTGRDRMSRPAQDAISDAANQWSEPTPPGVRTGIDPVDETLGGLRQGRLVCLAARPSVGKSALALQICRHAVEVTGKHVLLASLEMSDLEIAGRLVAHGGASLTRLDDQRTATRRDWEIVAQAGQHEPFGRLHIADSRDMSPGDLAALARRLHARHPLALIAVDYLQLMRIVQAPGQRENRATLIGQASRRLKVLAMSLDIPVLVLSQLNRGVEGTPDSRPKLSDLRESGRIEEDCDQVAFLYRPDRDLPAQLKMAVVKNRQGRITDPGTDIALDMLEGRFWVQPPRRLGGGVGAPAAGGSADAWAEAA